MCKCIICNREIKDTDDYELHGYDGDKIHKHCKSKCEEIYNAIDNMTDDAVLKTVKYYNELWKCKKQLRSMN